MWIERDRSADLKFCIGWKYIFERILLRRLGRVFVRINFVRAGRLNKIYDYWRSTWIAIFYDDGTLLNFYVFRIPA